MSAPSLIAIITLFTASLTSVAFAGEWRGSAEADDDTAPTIYTGGCGGCTDGASLNSDGAYRDYIVGPYAYANPENDAVTRSYYARPVHAPTHARIHRSVEPRQVSVRSHRYAVEPRMKTHYHQAKRPVARGKKLARRASPPASNVRVASIKTSAFTAPASIVAPSRPTLNEAPVFDTSVPNVVVANGQRVEIVSPDELNSIDLAADAPGLEQADVKADLAAAAPQQTDDQVIDANQVNVKVDAVAVAPPEQAAPRAASASPTLLAQALSVIAGALAGASVGLFLIGWRSVRISRLDYCDLHRHRRSSLIPHPAQIILRHVSPASMPGRAVL